MFDFQKFCCHDNEHTETIQQNLITISQTYIVYHKKNTNNQFTNFKQELNVKFKITISEFVKILYGFHNE